MKKKEAYKMKIMVAIGKSKKGLTRQEIYQVLHEAQGKKGKHSFSQGHYTTNFSTWVNVEKLIFRPKKNCHKLTPLGKLYVSNLAKYRLRVAREKARIYKKAYKDTCARLRNQAIDISNGKAELKTENSELKQRVAAQSQQLEDCEKVIRDLKNLLNEEMKKVEGLEKGIECCHDTIGRLERNPLEDEETINKLRMQIIELEEGGELTNRKEIEKLNDEIYSLKATIFQDDSESNRDAETTMLRQRLQDAEAFIDKLKIQLSSLMQDGVYKNDNATYFVKDCKIIMQLNIGGTFKTTESFMVGAAKIDDLSRDMKERFDDFHSNLKQW